MLPVAVSTPVSALTLGYLASLAQIGSASSITLGDALPSFVFAAGIVWWLAQKFQKLGDEQKALAAEIKSLGLELRRELKDRPCISAPHKCPANKP